MKDIMIVVASVSMIVSCSKDNFSAPDNEVAKERFSFTANGDCANTPKSQMIGEGGAVVWCEGDALSVFSMDAASHSNNVAESEIDSQNPAKADFTGLIEAGTTQFAAIYPYNADASYAEGCINTVLPINQTATAGSFANGAEIALAVGSRTPGQKDGVEVEFGHLCSVLSFTLPSSITFADKITICSKSGAAMAGNVSIDCSAKKIVSASSSSVVLDGSFEGGKTYCITVVPGTYQTGFRFTIETKGGNKYLRESTKDITIAAGINYSMGVLSLVVNDTEPKAVATIQHTVDADGLLNGTSVGLSISGIPSEFNDALSVKAKLKNADGIIVRSYSGAPVSDAVMDIENGFDYLPQGVYCLEAFYNNGSSKTYGISAVNPSSPAPVFSVKDGSYTSYNYGTGSDGFSKDATKANSLDSSTAWLSGSVTIDPSLLASYGQFTYSYDGQEKTVAGNSFSETKASQSWDAHSFSAKCVFDGVTVSAGKTLHVTGLPYRVTTDSAVPSGWTASGTSKSTGDFDVNRRYMAYSAHTAKSSGVQSYALSQPFHIPSNTDIVATIKCYMYAGLSSGSADVYMSASTKDIASNKIATLSGQGGYPYTCTWNNLSANLTFTPSVNKLCIHMTVSSGKGVSIVARGVYSDNISILYR